MKREICALLLLAALIAGSLWNIRKAERLTDEIEEHLALSEQAVRAGDSKYALDQFEAALRIWLAARGYTEVVLRHAELDSASDAFYDTLEALRGGEYRAVPAAFERLRYHLDCIAGMERVTLGTVF